MAEQNEQLQALRRQIDEVDTQLVALFEKRMEISVAVAHSKKGQNIGITDESREDAVVKNALSHLQNPDFEGELSAFMRTNIALSKATQRKLLMTGSGSFLPQASPGHIEGRVIYQGVSGAWGEQALLQVFPDRPYDGVESFADVFEQVANGDAVYGLVPIENSQSGAIGEVYDLLRRGGCYIVGETRVMVHQCLLGLPGAKLEAVREVLTHPEGFKQCRAYLKGRGWEEISCRNTAVAAQEVQRRADVRVTAIASRRAAEVFGLEVLQADIETDHTNQTRFIVIGKHPEEDAAFDHISLTFATAHRAGALGEVLMAFSSAGLNLSRIESRPMTAGTYRFFVDIAANISDAAVRKALSQAAAGSSYFEVLGCYKAAQAL